MKPSYQHTKCLLWVGAFSNHIHDYTIKTVHSYHFPAHEAKKFLLNEDEKIDGIIMTMINTPVEISSIQEIASQKGIPTFLYSGVYEQHAKDLTRTLGVDEYLYGPLLSSLMKRIEFIKKLKLYRKKNQFSDGVSTRLSSKPVPLAARRTFDILVSFTALLVLSPIFLLITLIILSGSKKVLVKASRRVGFGYRTFDLYKFNTFKSAMDSKNNPWLRHVGQFLNTTGLSELPTLFNVLKGDMSIVGSNPLTLCDAEKLTEDQIALRFMTPAGITGLWRDHAPN